MTGYEPCLLQTLNNHLSSRIEIEDSSDVELVQEIVHEMKDVLYGISAFNPLSGAQSLLPIPMDLTTNRNADEEMDKIDASQSVRSTQNKSVQSPSGPHVKSKRKSIRSLPLKNASKCNAPEKSQLSNTNSIPNDNTLGNISKEALLTNKAVCSSLKRTEGSESAQIA